MTEPELNTTTGSHFLSELASDQGIYKQFISYFIGFCSNNKLVLAVGSANIGQEHCGGKILEFMV